MLEFEIQTDLTVIPESIDFNFEELKVEISNRCEYYNNLVVTEDGIKEAKSDKAKLNKLIKAIEDKRKEVKAECLKPYTDFEVRCKEIVKLIAQPVNAIDSQIKAYDDKRIEEKRKTITEAFNDICDVDYISLDDVLNPKWKNATMKTETIISEISEKIVAIKSDIQTLEMSFGEEPFFMAVKQSYCKSFDLSATLRYANELKELEEQRRQQIATEEERKKQEQTPIKQETEINQEQINPVAQDTVAHQQVQSESVKYYKGRFEVKGTREQIIALRNFMTENQIEFCTIK